MEEVERSAEKTGRHRIDAGVTCPWCGSERVERVGEFGPQIIISQFMCNACGSPFEFIRNRGSNETRVESGGDDS